MWSLGKRAERYGQLPSEMAGISSLILAYWFDEAVGWFVSYIESMMSKRDDKGKPLYSLEKLLGIQTYAKVKRRRD